MCRARIALVWLAFASTMVAASFAAHATVMRQMDVEDLARAARVVAVVRVESVQAGWDHGSIRTNAMLVRESVIAGAAPAKIHVSVLGGTVDGISAVYTAATRFREGDRLVVFLEPRRGHDGEWLVTGEFQGAFAVEREAETGMEILVRAPLRDGVELVGSGEDLRSSLYLDELVARVHAARSRGPR